MFCTKCGKDNGDGNKFCIECGTPLKQASNDNKGVNTNNNPAHINDEENPWDNVPDGTTVISEASSLQNENMGSDLSTTVLNNSVTLVAKDGTEYCVEELPKTVGKGSAADCIIPGDEAISRVHVTIHNYNNDGYVIEDMNSTNKTYLNGNPLEPEELVVLNDGDNLKLGKSEFTVRL